jgi:hypothetical protein
LRLAGHGQINTKNNWRNIMCDEQVIKEKYGKDYTYEKWYSTEIDLEHLPKNKVVVFGDGETYCWMLTKKESVPAETLVMPKIADVYEEYIKLLTDEINELASMACHSGWKSNRISKGLELRNKITDLKSNFSV